MKKTYIMSDEAKEKRALNLGKYSQKGTPPSPKTLVSLRKMAKERVGKKRTLTYTKEALLKMRLAKLGKPLSIAHRLKMSNSHLGIMPKNMIRNGMYPSIKSGDYDINGKKMFFRSKWEANYALYLDFLKQKKEILQWEFEADVFVFDKIKFGTRSYRPDFKITNNNSSIEYHEVKGYMDSRSKTKLKRMKKYYPKVKLILIAKDEYYALKKMEKLLNWY